MQNDKSELAKAYFKDGYNCAQAVSLAFAPELNIDKDTLLRISSSFGGGMGRLREVCGAVSGMFIVLGMKYGYNDPKAVEDKKELYQKIQDLAERFSKMNGSIVCRDLLGLAVQKENPTPDLRNEQYYKSRPCVDMVGDAAKILDEFLRNNTQ